MLTDARRSATRLSVVLCDASPTLVAASIKKGSAAQTCFIERSTLTQVGHGVLSAPCFGWQGTARPTKSRLNMLTAVLYLSLVTSAATLASRMTADVSGRVREISPSVAEASVTLMDYRPICPVTTQLVTHGYLSAIHA